MSFQVRGPEKSGWLATVVNLTGGTTRRLVPKFVTCQAEEHKVIS